MNMPLAPAVYEIYNGPWYTRLYTSTVIMSKLNQIPADAQRVPFPRILEHFVGELYLVNQLDKLKIDGDSLGALVLAGTETGRRVRESRGYFIK